MTTRGGRNSPPRGARQPGLAKPLEALVFLLPLIVFSEAVSLYLSSYAVLAQQDRVVAFHLLRFCFQLFGSTGALMPPLAVVAILLSTQIVSRQPWRVRASVVGLMYVESLALAIPLLLFQRWVTLMGGGAAPGALGEAALGIGAGIYEELIFRLILISVVSILGTDLLGRPNVVVLPLAVVISALAFAGHHHQPVGRDPFDAGQFAFRTLAGLYLGTIFVVRGYGPAAGTHAAYNLIVLCQI